MPIEGTSQDSRDPNSPQWGYLKVKNPEEDLVYTAKDKNWNEYVMFVHDQDIQEIKSFDLVQRKIPGRTDLRFVMVPAQISITGHLCNKQSALLKRQLAALLKRQLAKSQLAKVSDDEQKGRLEEDIKFLDGLQNTIKKKGPINIPSPEKKFDKTTFWVAWVVGP